MKLKAFGLAPLTASCALADRLVLGNVPAVEDSPNRSSEIADLEKAIAADQTNRSARTLLVERYVRSNRLAEAEKVLDEALKRDPNDFDARLQRGSLWVSRGRTAEAEALITAALKARPSSPEAHYEMAKLHRFRAAYVNERQELGETIRLRQSHLQARLELARSLTNAGRHAEAHKILDEAPGGQANSMPVLIERNWAWIAAGNHGELAKGVSKALSISRSPAAVFQQAVLRIAERDFDGARTSVTEVLARNPEDLAALQTLAQIDSARRRPDDTVQQVREYLKVRPKSYTLHSFLGHVLLISHKPAEARIAFTAASRIDPSSRETALALARTDLAEGNAAKARVRATALGANQPEALALLAEIEDRAGNRAGVIKHLRALLALDSQNRLALNGLAYSLADVPGKSAEALKYAEQARALSPGDPDVADTVGWVHYHRGDYRAAVQHFEQSVAKSTNPVPRYHLAMAYFKAGNADRARQILQEALKQNPNVPEAAVARQLLASR